MKGSGGDHSSEANTIHLHTDWGRVIQDAAFIAFGIVEATVGLWGLLQMWQSIPAFLAIPWVGQVLGNVAWRVMCTLGALFAAGISTIFHNVIDISLQFYGLPLWLYTVMSAIALIADATALTLGAMATIGNIAAVGPALGKLISLVLSGGPALQGLVGTISDEEDANNIVNCGGSLSRTCPASQTQGGQATSSKRNR